MITLKCPKHPRYNAERPPKAACEPCKIIERAKVEFDQAVALLRRVEEKYGRTN